MTFNDKLLICPFCGHGTSRTSRGYIHMSSRRIIYFHPRCLYHAMKGCAAKDTIFPKIGRHPKILVIGFQGLMKVKGVKA